MKPMRFGVERKYKASMKDYDAHVSRQDSRLRRDWGEGNSRPCIGFEAGGARISALERLENERRAIKSLPPDEQLIRLAELQRQFRDL